MLSTQCPAEHLQLDLSTPCTKDRSSVGRCRGCSSRIWAAQPLLAAAGSTLPRSWQLDQELLGDVPLLSLPLADLERFEAQHTSTLGSHARNIRAIAPEVALQANAERCATAAMACAPAVSPAHA